MTWRHLVRCTNPSNRLGIRNPYLKMGFELSRLINILPIQMQSWAQSKQLPGQFTGSTDAHILTPEELAGPAHMQAWVRKVWLVCDALFHASAFYHISINSRMQ